MRPVLLISLITFLIAGGAFGGDYNLVDQFRVPPAEGAIAADPIVDSEGVLRGFIYVSPDYQTIQFGDLSKSPLISTSYESTILKTINRQQGDTLTIYSLVSDYAQGGLHNIPKIEVIEDRAGTVSSFHLVPELNLPLGDYFMTQYIGGCNVDFAGWKHDSDLGVLFSCRQMFYDEVNGGYTYQSISTSRLYSLDLSTVKLEDSFSSLVLGNFSCDTSKDVCGSTSNYYHWDFRNFPHDSNYGTLRSVDVTAASVDLGVLAEQSTADVSGVELFSGDFVDDPTGCDELICSGNSKDLLGLHGTTPRGHVACYSFHDGIPKEEWYRPLTPDLDFYFAWGGFITEIRDDAQIAHLNVSNGQFTEVHSLPLSGYTRFFTTGPQNSELNLLTLQNDTLRHYRYDIATPVEEPGVGPNLPRSFTLEQNYPNPFNGETVIRFQLTRPENISIRVYNVRGQQVAQIADGPFVSGSHQVTWKPADDIASGVYFVSLSGNSGSQSVRMQYVK